MARRIAVIGGGIGGLACAWRLQQRDPTASIRVFEASAQWGGVTRTRLSDGWVLEEGPDSLITAKPAGLLLLRELGLEERLQPTRPEARRAFVVRRGRLVPVPEGLYLLAPGKLWPFACSRLVSWSGKLRMGLDLLLPRRDPAQGEESLAAFVRRRLGREALARIAQPMVGGIYTADPERLSLAATMPQFLEMEREHRSLILAMRARAKRARAQADATGPRYGLFVSLPGGLGELAEALCARLDPASLQAETPITGLARAADGWQLQGAEAAGSFDAVVLALPAHAAAQVLTGVDAALAGDLAAIPYASVATVNLGFRAEQIARLPAGAGFVVPSCEHRLLLACTISSGKYPDRAPAGHVLLRAFVGGGLHEGDLAASDAGLIAGCVRELGDLLGISGEPVRSHLCRWPRAMAQYVLGHRERVERIRTAERALGGLALVGNGYEGVGIPDIAAQASAAAERLVPDAEPS